MRFSSSTYMAPSGIFVAARGYTGGEALPPDGFSPIYNPGVLEKYRENYNIVEVFEKDSDRWFEELSRSAVRVEDFDFLAYAEEVTSLTSGLQGFRPHCLLGPLRGASKPCTLAEVMSKGELSYDYFNFQRGSEPTNKSRVLGDLSRILELRDPQDSIFRINVTDVVKGGQGINALTSALAETKANNGSFQKQTWKLRLDLLHDDSVNFERIEKVKALASSGFEIDVVYHSVPNLIFEDYDPALAFELDTGGEKFTFKPRAEPGSMLFVKGNEVFSVETTNANLMLEQFTAQGVTDYLINYSNLSQTGDVWVDYQEKG